MLSYKAQFQLNDQGWMTLSEKESAIILNQGHMRVFWSIVRSRGWSGFPTTWHSLYTSSTRYSTIFDWFGQVLSNRRIVRRLWDIRKLWRRSAFESERSRFWWKARNIDSFLLAVIRILSEDSMSSYNTLSRGENPLRDVVAGSYVCTDNLSLVSKRRSDGIRWSAELASSLIRNYQYSWSLVGFVLDIWEYESLRADWLVGLAVRQT